MKYNAIFNTDKIIIGNKKDDENNKINNKTIINEEEMSYVQLFEYNLNDLMYIYNYIKSFGANTCNFLVKYDIVKEILIHQYFTKKKYGEFDNNKNGNNNFTNNIFDQILSEENNGICKKILFSSNINYINFLNKFATYNNNYININELFTCLLLLGSLLITSDKIVEIIKDNLPENKKESKNILLTKEEFMKIPMWFEKDEYLNVLVDSKEEEYYLDISKYYYSEENINNNDNDNNKPIKINCIKDAIFEINSEDNILDINKIIILINKINGVDELKNIEENKKEKEKDNNQMISEMNNSNNIIKNADDDINKKIEIDIGNASSLNDINISKGKETDSKGTLTIQSDLDIRKRRKHLDNKENINNIFNALFLP
jgi:hypothetical protein